MNEMRTIRSGSTGVLLLFFAVVGLCQTREERRAAAALQQAVEADCVRLIKENKLSDALDRYLELFSLDIRSNYFTAHNVIPKLAVATGRYDAGASIFDRFPPSQGPGLAGVDNEGFMALCLAKCGRWQDARKALSWEFVRSGYGQDAIRQFFPKYDTNAGFLALAWERCGYAYISRDPDRQIFYLKRAHEADPRNLWISARLASRQFNAKYYEDCLKTSAAIVSINPKFGGFKSKMTSCRMLIERGESRTMPDPSKFKTKF